MQVLLHTSNSWTLSWPATRSSSATVLVVAADRLIERNEFSLGLFYPTSHDSHRYFLYSGSSSNTSLPRVVFRRNKRLYRMTIGRRRIRWSLLVNGGGREEGGSQALRHRLAACRRCSLLCSDILGTRPSQEHAMSTHVPDPFFRLAARRGLCCWLLVACLLPCPAPACCPTRSKARQGPVLRKHQQQQQQQRKKQKQTSKQANKPASRYGEYM